LNEPNDQLEQVPSSDSAQNMKLSLRNKLLIGGAGVALVGVVAAGVGLSANGRRATEVTSPSASATDSHTGAAKPAIDLQRTMEAAILARPAEGTPEYKGLFASMELPAATETNPTAVVDAYSNAMLVKLPKLMISDAPGGGKDETVTSWAFQGDGRSINALVSQLNVQYYLDGFMATTFGEGWRSDSENVDFEENTLLPEVTQIVANLLGDGSDNSQLHLQELDYGIQASTGATIVAMPKGELIYGDATSVSNGLLKFTVRDGKWVSTNPNH
jgi:hypothetical protein